MDLKTGDIYLQKSDTGEGQILCLYLYTDRDNWRVSFYIGGMLHGKPKLCDVDNIHMKISPPLMHRSILTKSTIKAQWKIGMSKRMIRLFFKHKID